MIIKLLVDVLQILQRGSPVFIWDLNWLDFEGVHEVLPALSFGCSTQKNTL